MTFSVLNPQQNRRYNNRCDQYTAYPLFIPYKEDTNDMGMNRVATHDR